MDHHPGAGDPSPRPSEADTTYATQIGAIARWAPHRRAVEQTGADRTFGELFGRSCRLAHALLVKFTPEGGAIGAHSRSGAETIEVVLATALIDARAVVLGPGLGPNELLDRCREERLVGIVIDEDVVAAASGVMSRLDHLNFAFVVEPQGQPTTPRPPATLAGAAPYEATLAAYPAEPPDARGPRLRPVHVPQPALTLPQPAPELVVEPGGRLDPTAVLGCLAMGGRIRVATDNPGDAPDEVAPN